jgi:hypothetical protein
MCRILKGCCPKTIIGKKNEGRCVHDALSKKWRNKNGRPENRRIPFFDAKGAVGAFGR